MFDIHNGSYLIVSRGFPPVTRFSMKKLWIGDKRWYRHKTVEWGIGGMVIPTLILSWSPPLSHFYWRHRRCSPPLEFLDNFSLFVSLNKLRRTKKVKTTLFSVFKIHSNHPLSPATIDNASTCQKSKKEGSKVDISYCVYWQGVVDGWSQGQRLPK